ncbi:hypothetical protein ACHQM5_003105 [Ranunculus cassubicifolius]
MKIERDFILQNEIGSGGSSFVRLCRRRSNGAKFACKSIPKDQEPLDDEQDRDLAASIRREVLLMQHLQAHPGIVHLEAVYEDSEYFHLVMEFVSGGDLLDQMENNKEWPCSESRAAVMVKELASILKYCHDNGVVHRDVKPENILVTSEGRLKLADFGLATRFRKGQRLCGAFGSEEYAAPEVLGGDYTENVDIWSLGVLLHGMLVGALPFEGDSNTQVLEAVKNANLCFEGEAWELISEPARDLIGKMLTRDVLERLSAEEVLQHPWILHHREDQTSSESKQTEISSIHSSVEDSLSLALSHAMRMSESKQCVPSIAALHSPSMKVSAF